MKLNKEENPNTFGKENRRNMTGFLHNHLIQVTTNIINRRYKTDWAKIQKQKHVTLSTNH